MSLYGNTFLNESKLIKLESSNLQIEKSTKKYGPDYIITNLKLPECDEPYISIDYKKDITDDFKNNIERDFKILKSKYKEIVNKVFEDYSKDAYEWGMDNIKSGTQLQKMTNLAHVYYHNFDKVSIFELWYNDGKNRNRNFFGDHCLIIEIKIKNNDAILGNTSLEG